MLSSITPFGERSRNSRWGITVTCYVAGSTLAGAMLGTALGTVSLLPRAVLSGSVALTVLAAASLLGAAIDAGWLAVPYPSWSRQVNEVWLTTYRGWVYGGGFGFQLGLGVVTIVTTATLWLTWLAAVLSGSWWRGLAIGAAFGLTRALLVLFTAPVKDPSALRALHRRLATTGPMVKRGATAIVAGAGVAALVVVAAA
jgi:hypothetical protein